MEKNKKDLIKLKFAICLNKFLLENKKNNNENEIIDVISSLRQMEASSGVSFPIIQLTSIASRDIQITTAIRLIESLNIKLSEFFALYESLDENDLKKGKLEIEKRRKTL